ncbi:MAG TPA: hypothetical protein VGC07_10045 [Granulicella sp.]
MDKKQLQLRKLLAGFMLGAVMYLPGMAQTSKSGAASAKEDSATTTWKPRLLPDGQPDVQGVWTTVYYGMGCLTNPTNGDVNCVPPPGPRPAPGTANAGGPPAPDTKDNTLGQRGHGNPPSIVNVAAQAEKGGDGARPRRAPRNAPSRIIDTDNYDIPYTPEALVHQKDLFAHYYEPARYGDIDPQQRCWPLGAVRQFTWHDVQVEQFPGYLLLIFEGAEQYRIIYLDNRPHIGNNLKLWMGDSRGHWEGTTLVVDTTSNNAKGRLSRAGDFSSDKVHYTERFKFLDENRVRYEAVFDDPSTYTRPWTFAFDEHRAFFGGDGGVPEGPVTAETQAKYENWEEACQEGLIPGGNDIPGLPPVPPDDSK